jgi:triosephosphate isomerase
MAKPILIANWKNHPSSLEEVKTLLKDLSKKSDLYKKVSLFIAPPLPYLTEVGSRITKYAKLGVQDINALPKGTYTGEVTTDILKSFGARLAIIGHSEQRALGVTNEMVGAKVKTALKAGMVPVVCIGESARDTEGEHFEVLREQIKATLSGLSKQSLASILLAYEPVWAIGKKGSEAISPADLNQSLLFIRKIISDLYGRKSAESVVIIYGGSVDQSNATQLVKEGGVKGFLAGRASLKAKVLESIALSLIQK